MSTTTATSITQTGATTGGNITDAGGGTITARGVAYATTETPTTAGTHTSDGTGSGAFSSVLTGLTAGTTYHVRAYATNSAGTSYGDEITFETSAIIVPTVTSTAASSITQTGATAGGNVTADGGATVTARGVVYALTADPTLSNSVVTSGTGTGAFTADLTSLTPGTTYHFRAYATNSAGTAYGADLTFATSPVLIPTLTTTAVTAITLTGGTSGGDITSDGGGTVTARGVCYATTQNPTTSNSVVSSGTGTGVFASTITGLAQVHNTMYALTLPTAQVQHTVHRLYSIPMLQILTETHTKQLPSEHRHGLLKTSKQSITAIIL